MVFGLDGLSPNTRGCEVGKLAQVIEDAPFSEHAWV